MTNGPLEIFIDQILHKGDITLADVRHLQRDVLPDGIMSRDEADMLIALDRAIETTHCSWSAFAVQTVVDFVVWTCRPTGYVDRDAATWLVGSLSAGRGPTPVAEAIAFDVVREAEGCDGQLVEFVMRAARGGPSAILAGMAEKLAA